MGTCCSSETTKGIGDGASDTIYNADSEQPGDNKAVKPCVRSPPVKFTLKVHSAELSRSFAKVGNMDPFAVVRAMEFVNSEFREVLRTEQHVRGDRNPTWDAEKTLDDVPEAVQIDVWDKNSFHKNVFCGSATIPITSEMGYIDMQDFQLEKREKSTGTVCITLQIGDAQPAEMQRCKTTFTIGGEMDEMIAGLGLKRDKSKKKTTLKLQGMKLPVECNANDEEDEEPEDAGGGAVVKLISRPASAFPANALMGSWTCVATQGLDEFLIASGAGMFQRKIAGAAKWPAWDFAADGDKIVFVNHSAIGDIREELPLAKEYDWVDGKNNKWLCEATWTATDDGGSLVVSRKGSPGDYSEERKVTGDKLEFTLSNPKCGASWGRTFSRDK